MLLKEVLRFAWDSQQWVGKWWETPKCFKKGVVGRAVELLVTTSSLQTEKLRIGDNDDDGNDFTRNPARNACSQNLTNCN